MKNATIGLEPPDMFPELLQVLGIERQPIEVTMIGTELRGPERVTIEFPKSAVTEAVEAQLGRPMALSLDDGVTIRADVPQDVPIEEGVAVMDRNVLLFTIPSAGFGSRRFCPGDTLVLHRVKMVLT